MKIVIIEDEAHTAEDLAQTIIKVDPSATIVASIRSVKEAIQYFRKKEMPDLIFSDIQLGDGLSFEIYNTISSTIPIIFCTAYDDYALKAFKVNGIDYILKPYSKKTVAEALNRYNDLKNNFSRKINNYEAILDLLETSRVKKQTSVLVYHKDKILPVKMDEIAAFYIENEITRLITFDHAVYVITKTLEEVEAICGIEFYRANRQFIVNKKAVKDATQSFGRKLNVNLTITFKEKIIISKIKATDFLSWLGS
jgi:two-component system response regulator LytT